MRRFMVKLATLLAAGSLAPAQLASAQETGEGTRGPRFLLASASSGRTVPLDVSRTPVLRQRISLDLDGVTLKEALAAIASRAGLELAYTGDVLPLQGRVRLRADEITVAAALTDVLVDANVDVVFTPEGRAILKKRVGAERLQTGTISGSVRDSATGQPIALAELRVVGTQIRATADDSGQYVLREVPAGEQRVNARRIGYGSQTRTVSVAEGGTATLDFALSVAATRLDELVTTVTGDQRRLELGHTVVSIRADSLLRDAPAMSFGDLLQGRAPGVLSLQNGNSVGQAGMIRLRGLNSFGVPDDPIVVVDGVRVEATAGNYGFSGLFGSPTSTTTAGGFSGRLGDLNPAEIASVEIVKGPSAATLYGTDAANGVIVITTKRGQPGRARWTAFTEQGVLEQRLEDWGAPYGGAPYYAFGHSTTDGSPQRCTLVQRAAGSCALDSLVSFNAFTHPDTRPFKNGRRQQYGLQVSGGTAGGATYFLSGEYEQETGTPYMPLADQAFLRAQRGVGELPDWQLRPNAFDKVNVRANLTAPLGGRASVTLATGFVSNEARRPTAGLPSELSGSRSINDGWGILRPAAQFAWRGQDVVRRFIGSIATTYNVREWLTLRGTVGADLSTNDFGTLLRRGEWIPGTSFSERTANQLDVTRYSLDLGTTVTHALSDAVGSKTSIGVQYNRRAQRGSSTTATNLPQGGETIAGAADPLTASEATITTAVAGGYVEEALSFRDRLFLTGAVRLDGGSAFGKDFSVAVYPKASLSWVMTDGQTGPQLPGVSSLRFRAAYGASGVQPGPFAALQQIQVITGASGTRAVPAAQLGAFGNAGLKPERSSELEAGMDLELAAGRLRLEFTGYQRTSHDALINRTLAPSVGGSSRWENIGSVRNRGLELLLAADVLRGRVLSAGLTLTGTLNDNKLLKLGQGVIVSSPVTEGFRQDVGYPLYGLWGRQIESYADANGNGIMESGEITLTDNQYIGPGFPTREATAAPYLGLFGERLQLHGLLQYRGGFHIYNESYGGSCLNAQSCRAVNDISTPLADQARAVAYSQFFAVGPLIEPASYLLLRELSAGLTLPRGWARAVGAQEGRLVLAARNVAVLWRQGTALAPESGLVNVIGEVTDGVGLPTYWLMRLSLNY